MARACHTAVRLATGKAFSDEEIDDFLNRMESRARRAKADDPTATDRAALAKAAGELTREQLLEALTQKRMRVAAQIAKTGRQAHLAGLPTSMTEAQKLEALNVGSERQGLGTSSSVDAEGRARQMSLWGQVEIGLKQMPGLIDRLSNFWGVGETGFDRLVAKEMARLNGDGSVEPTGDEGALHAARVLVAAQTAARLMQNEVGAWIGEHVGYIARQTHDPDKISGGLWAEMAEAGRRLKATGIKDVDWAQVRAAAERRAFGAWRDFITPLLDDKTFAGLDPKDVTPEETAEAQALAARGILKDPADLKERMLHAVWMDIVTGRHAELTGATDLGDFRPKGSLARTVSKARVLHFRSPDAWVDYNSKFGRGNLLATVMSQLERAGRNAALMRTWGPAPEAAYEAEKARLANAARRRGDVAAVKALDSTLLRSRFDAVNGLGEAPDNLRLAQVFRGLRAWEGLTKLGSIVLSKATDLPMTGHTFARAGAGFLEGYGAFFHGVTRLGSDDAKAAADALDVGARAFAGHMGGQFMTTDGAKGWTTWASRLLYRVNGFSWFNEAVRHGAASAFSAYLGREAGKAFEDLHIGTRETLERFGITPQDWDLARRGLAPAGDGRTYFTLDHFDALAKEGPKTAAASADAKLKFAMMIHNVLDDTVSEPRARERSGMTRGSQAGTVWGEIQRSFFQFKGFVNAIVGRHLIPASRGYAGYKPVALMAHFIIGSALAGYVSMNAKAIARGEVPKPVLGATFGDTLKIWGASLAQGGGLGLYGDFLFGELNRNGSDFDWGSLGGPLLSDSETVAKVVRQAISGGAVNQSTGRSQIPGELVKLASQNTPLVNLWYTRLALDYLVYWRLQEAVSPGYLQRYDQRVRNQEHSGFWLSPTSAG